MYVFPFIVKARVPKILGCVFKFACEDMFPSIYEKNREKF